MKVFTRTALLASAFFAASLAQVAAQAQNDFARDQDFGVLDRPRPEYDAIGIPLSSFLLFPQLVVAGNYNDNILAAQTSTESDFFVQFQPSLSLKSQWSQNELDLTLHSSINRYADYSSEDTNDYGAGINGRLDVLSSINVTGSASYDLETLSRESEAAPNNTVSPIQYSVWNSKLAATEQFNRLQVSLSGTWDSYNYLDGTDALGGVVDEHFLNVEDTVQTLRADYAISPDTAVFVSGDLNQHAYALQPPAVLYDFNSTGYEVLGGVNFQITSLVQGEVSAGYLSQDVPNVAGQDYGNLAMHAAVKWFPTELTTVSVKADRIVQSSVNELSSSYVTTGGLVEVDQELRYNLILTGLFSYYDDSYQGIDRDDKRWTAGFAAKYLLNRNVGVSLNFSHDGLDSEGTDRYISFNVNKVMLSLVLQK